MKFMVDALYNLSLRVPDLLILFVCAMLFGALGVLIASLSHRFWWSRMGEHAETARGVGDGVHSSVLALIAFLLALITTGELSSFSNADRQITQEGLAIKRLDRELTLLGEQGQQGRKLLRDYVGSVTGDEWARLARRPQSLSPAAEQDLDELWTEVRRLQEVVRASNPGVSSELNDNLHKIEDARISRLSASVNSIPDVVWLMMGIFFLTACILAGRHKMSRFSRQVVFIQMSALGVILALDIIIDNPFGGDTSLGPEPIVSAVRSAS